MLGRMEKVLALALVHGHEVLVLGAWGCGVFGNDPALVAGWFARLLAGDGPVPDGVPQGVLRRPGSDPGSGDDRALRAALRGGVGRRGPSPRPRRVRGDPSRVDKAPRAEYRLRSTGQVVANPDDLAKVTIREPD